MYLISSHIFSLGDVNEHKAMIPRHLPRFRFHREGCEGLFWVRIEDLRRLLLELFILLLLWLWLLDNIGSNALF